jgi:hypothetical protein
MNLKVQHFKIGLNNCVYQNSSIAINDAAVIVVRGCLLQLIVCRGFYFVGGGSFYPIANEVAKGYTCSNATFHLKVQHFKIGLNNFFLSKYKDVTGGQTDERKVALNVS